MAWWQISGDTDDARTIPFVLAPLRSHGAIVELVSAWRGESSGHFRFSDPEALAVKFTAGSAKPRAPVVEVSELATSPMVGITF